MNSIWVPALAGQMYQALQQALCAPYSDHKLKEPCSFTKVPDGPQGPKRRNADMRV